MDRTHDPIAAAAAAGVGARITLSVMADDHVRHILRALEQTDTGDLEIDTDRVSTFVRGEEGRVLAYLADLVAGAARDGDHVVATVMLSRGCPGEVCGAVPPPPATTPDLAPRGLPVQAQWALYPLLDGGGPPSDHLAPVWAAIERSRERGTFVREEHFVTTLAGDVSDVLATAADAWLAAGRVVPHVTTHLTVVANSPSSGLR